MWIYNISVLIYFLNITWALTDRERLTIGCKENTIQAEEQKVWDYVFANYDSLQPPCANKTTVELVLYPRTIEFSEMSSTLDIHCQTVTNWIDERLMWDNKKFNLSDYGFHVSESEIWMPDITVHSSGDLGLDQTPSSTHCLLFYTGGVWCKSSVVYTVRCYTDFTAWPYDIQYCDVQLGSWAHDSTVLNLTSKWTHWMWKLYVPNPQWEIVYNYSGITHTKNKYESENLSYILWLQIVLKRHSNIMQAIYITPAIVLMVLTLTALWLESKSNERLIIVCINFICHLLCIQNLQWRLPSNGQASPLILLFYENSLILAAFTLLLTMILSKLQKLSKEAPKFLVIATTSVLKSKMGRVFFINILDPKTYVGLQEVEDDTIFISTMKKDQTWKYVSILIGWISFTAILITYLVMLIIYIPSNSSEYNIDLFEMRLRNVSKTDNIITD